MRCWRWSSWRRCWSLRDRRAPRRRPGAAPAAAARPRGPGVLAVHVPDHGSGRQPTPRRAGAAPALPRRAAPAVQRARRVDGARRSAADGAARGDRRRHGARGACWSSRASPGSGSAAGEAVGGRGRGPGSALRRAAGRRCSTPGSWSVPCAPRSAAPHAEASWLPIVSGARGRERRRRQQAWRRISADRRSHAVPAVHGNPDRIEHRVRMRALAEEADRARRGGVVHVLTLGRGRQHDDPDRRDGRDHTLRVASIPFMTGIDRSMSTTSGAVSRATDGPRPRPRPRRPPTCRPPPR